MSQPPGPPPPPGGWPPGSGWQPPSGPPPAGPPSAPPPWPTHQQPGGPYPQPPQYGPPPGGYPTGPYGAPQPYPPAPKGSRTTPILIVVGVVVAIAAVVIGVVALSGGSDSKSSAQPGVSVSQAPATSGSLRVSSAPAPAPSTTAAQDVSAISHRLRTACTGALAKDIAALVPSHMPLHDPSDSGPDGGYQFAICSAQQSIKNHPRVFHSLSVDLTLFASKSVSPAMNASQCRTEVTTIRSALVKAGHKVVDAPALGDVTVATTERLSDAWAVDVAACRGGLEVRASYRAFAITGSAPDVNDLLQSDVTFVRNAFSHLGA